MVKEKTFAFFCLCFCHLVGVFADELKSVSVMEGESVTLHFNITEIQRNDLITWMFGTNKNLIAKTTGETSEILDVPDGRFRDRLKLDMKTGSLTITNTTTEHAGDYEAEISRKSSDSKHIFTVTVHATTTPDLHSTSYSTSRLPSGPPSGPPLGPASGSSDSHYLIKLISAAAAAGFLLLVVLVGIFYIWKQRKTNQQVETSEEEITYADPTFYKRNTHKSEDEVIYAGVVTRR